MTEPRSSSVDSDVADVLCRSRFRARSRASSNATATADERLLVLPAIPNASIAGCLWDGCGLLSASSAW